MDFPIILLLSYYVLICIVSFALMGVDKQAAKREARRISERTLFLVAFLGGGLGAFLGMQTFRHKTQHWYFRYGFPMLALFQASLLIAFLVWYYLGGAATVQM